MGLITRAASTEKRNVTVWRPSVCLSCHHTNRDSSGVACDAASVQFGPTMRRTDILITSPAEGDGKLCNMFLPTSVDTFIGL